jgi:surface antigen bspA-like
LLTAALLAAVFPFAPLTVDAADEFIEDYYIYTVFEDETGSLAARITYCDIAISGDVVIPSTLGGYPLVEIGGDAFSDCTSLTSVTIPGSVTKISGGAFSGCTSLREIMFPNSVTEIAGSAFSYCTSLMEVTIPGSVTKIGNYAFSGCTGLKRVTLLDGVTTIGSGIFHGCTGLTEVTIPGSVTKTGEYAFYGCTGLREITLIDGLAEVGYGMFHGCTGLTEVTIPGSVTNIGYYAFSDCTSLREVTLLDGVITLEFTAFTGCTSLTSVTIPDSVENFGLLMPYNVCEDLTIYCHSGSEAHKFAIKKRIPYVLLGETDPEPKPDPDLDIDEEAGMIRSEAGMTIEALLAGLAGGSYTVTDANGAALVGTGAVVTRTAAGETVRYTVVVRGDVNGDGRQTATDYLRTKRAVLKIEAPEGVYYEAAACFDGRDGLTAADYLSMKRAILGLA